MEFIEEKKKSPLMSFRLLVFPGSYRRFEEIGVGIVMGETMTGTGDQVEQLRNAVEEIECLRYEEE